MQPETELPEMISMESNLGIFLMKNDNGKYSGKANGFGLKLSIDVQDNSFETVLYSDEEKYAFATVNTSGKFDYLSDCIAKISSWVDNVCLEAIEDYANDVQFLETKNGRLAYWKYNTHLNTTPVVFVHGGPGGDSNPVKARRLHLHNPVYLYDQMGCGMSDPIQDLDSWTADDYAEELQTLIETIPSDKVILIGASWGAGLSVAYAAKSKCARIKAMVLPSPFLSTRKWSEDAETNLSAMSGDYLEIYKECVAKNDFGPRFTKVLEEYNSRFLFNREIYREYAIASASETPNEVFQKLCGPNDLYTNGNLIDFDVTWYLPEINVPVLLMCADSDEVTIPRIMEYYNQIKNSRLSIIPHAGHVLASEQFDSYKDAIRAFFIENKL